MSSNKNLAKIIALMAVIISLGVIVYFYLSSKQGYEKVGGVDMQEAYKIYEKNVQKTNLLSENMFKAVLKSCEEGLSLSTDDIKKIFTVEGRSVDSETKKDKSKKLFEEIFGNIQEFEKKSSKWLLIFETLQIDEKAKGIKNLSFDVAKHAEVIKKIGDNIKAVDTVKKLCSEELFTSLNESADDKLSLVGAVLGYIYNKVLDSD